MKQLIAAALLSVPFLASAQNLVNNGSFEETVQANGTWNIYQNLPGWTGGTPGIELRNNVAGAAFDGVNYVELDTNRNSLMFQNIGTTLDQAYTLSFAYSARAGVAALSNGIEVLWNGVVAGTYAAQGTGNGNSWNTFSLNVFGGAPVSTLTFRAIGTSDSYGGSLDNVSVTAVPEPETYALMLAGLGLVGFMARRRRPS